MSSHTHPTLGSLIALDADARRDAIHVAIAPFTAGARLLAGHPFTLGANGDALHGQMDGCIGVVDPFLADGVVLKGERFWGCIKPGTTSNLRHEWDCHALPAPPAPAAQVVERIVEKPEDPEVTAVRAFAKDHGLTLEQVIAEATQNLGAECRNCY